MIRLLKKYFVQALAFGSIMTFREFGQNGTELVYYFIYITIDFGTEKRAIRLCDLYNGNIDDLK